MFGGGELLILGVLTLGLVIISINNNVLKLSISILLIISQSGGDHSFLSDFFLEVFVNGLGIGWHPSDSVFFPETFMGGLWFENGWPPSGSDSFRAWVESGWIETTKLIIILGSVAVLLMVDAERLIFPKFFGARVCGTFFQRNAHLPILNLIVALGSLCLVSSSN